MALSTPGRVLLKRHVRESKYDPLVDEVELLDANPEYAHVRFPSGRETTVSLRHLAPRGDVDLRVPGLTTGSDPSDHVPLPRDDASRSDDAARCDFHVPIESETVREKDKVIESVCV